MIQTQSAEEKARLKKQWTDLSIKQALASQWPEAIETNKHILNIFPSDYEALNRLGKAYSEIGQYAEARNSYAQTLHYSPQNTIAKKNLERLSMLQEEQDHTYTGSGHIDPQMTIDETGKAGVTVLNNIASTIIIAKMSIGDKVQLYVNGHRLLVQNAAGKDIGQIEPRLANRLINLMEGGIRYAAAIRAIEQGQVRITIREEHKPTHMHNTVSFPSQGTGDTVRGHIRDSMLRYDRENEDESGNEDEYYEGGDEPEEAAEIDFDGNTESEE